MTKSHLCAGVLALALLAVPVVGQANDDLQNLINDPKQWVTQLGNYEGQRYSALNQITKENVGDLQPAWSFSTGVLRGHEGGPLVVGNVMYISTPFPNIVYALDLNDNGKVLWRYQPEQDPNVIPVMCCDTVTRGVAYANNTIFLGQADATVLALDAQTGAVKWSVKNGDPNKGETLTMSPLVVKDKLIVGISGGEYGVRGHMTAYNINDGAQVWRAYSTGPDNEMLVDPQQTTHLGQPIGADSSLKTWEGDEWQIGGGTTWGWVTYDPELDLIYYGTGNPGTWNPAQRPGDNKWSMTVMARNPDTGMAKWFFQKTPHDEWDYDGVNEHILADLTIDGQETPALVVFDRNGFAYTMNRDTGALLKAEKYDPAVNWATDIDMETGRPNVVAEFSTAQNGPDVNTTNICPAALGSKDQQPASFSPVTKVFYVPTNHVCMDYEPFEVSYTAGQPYVGATLSMYPPQGSDNLGNFIAWDAAEAKILWSKPEPFSVWSGALSTAGDVVFYGTLEGYLKAVDPSNGEELYSFKTPSGIIGNVTSYEHNGKQYIAVLSGVGGWAGIGLAAGLTEGTEGLGAVGAYQSLADYTQLGGVLTVFALPD